MGWCSMEVSSAFWMVDGRGRLSIVDGGLGGEGCVGRVVCKQAEASFMWITAFTSVSPLKGS